MRNNHPTSSFSYGRIIVVLWFGLWFYVPGAATIFELISIEQSWHSWSVFYIYYTHLVMSVAIFLIVIASKIRWAAIIGKDLPTVEIPPALKLTIFLFVFSICAAYVLFIPLSYIAPNFVQWWYLDIPPIIFYESGSYPVFVNILGFLSLVVVGPIIEEVLFRGLLLRRWIKKWSLVTAIILSSLLFGALHADPIGAFAFGVGMCVLYLRTQSLYIPIICHAANNLFVWLIEAGYIFWNGPNYQYTIETLRSEWYIGLICGVIIARWATNYLRTPIQSREWRLPAT